MKKYEFTVETDFAEIKMDVHDIFRMMLKKFSVRDLIKRLVSVGITDYLTKVTVFPSCMLASESDKQNAEDTLVFGYASREYESLLEEAEKAAAEAMI
jgi:uncharacterized protein (UPF0128 family)